MGVACPPGLKDDKLGRSLTVQGGFGVGHAGKAGDTAGNGRGCAGGNGFVFFAPGFAKVNMHVNQPRANNFPDNMEFTVGFSLRKISDRGNLIAFDPKVRNQIDGLRRVDDPPTPKYRDRHDPIHLSQRPIPFEDIPII